MAVTMKTRKVVVDDKILERAREVVATWPANKARSYLRGMISVKPECPTSDQLRILLDRVEK